MCIIYGQGSLSASSTPQRMNMLLIPRELWAKGEEVKCWRISRKHLTFQRNSRITTEEF